MNKKTQITISVLYISLFLLSGCSNNAKQQTIQEKDDIIIKDNQKNQESTLQNNNSCPRGLTCATPGRCGLFTDNDNNQICDAGENTKNN